MNPTKDDYRSHEEYVNRHRKLLELQALGIEPYPHAFPATATLAAIKERLTDSPVGDSEAAAAGQTEEAALAGRLVLHRSMGKNTFAQLQSGQDRLQVMFNNEKTSLTGYHPNGEEGGLTPYKVLEKKLDLGDIVGVRGHLFRTQKGELTLFAKEVTLLSKSLLPLADKHSGLADKELRYRKRWLDMIANPEVHHTFQIRSQIITLVRAYLTDQRFLEVETPVLQSVYGGAEARPFTTNLHALDQEMFLRISLEIPLKKLIIAGIERVFELGRVFRNEGIDRTHNPEFTMVEAYAAYWDYNDMMRFVEELFQKVALTLFGKTTLIVPHPHGQGDLELELKAPWRRLTMKESIKEYGGYDVDALNDPEICKILLTSATCDPKEVAKMPRGRLIAELFELVAEPHLLQPHHITDHPIETTPLCKLHRNAAERKNGIVERFESFILSSEICNAYTELNDPIFQRELLERQAGQRLEGDVTANPLDEEFLEAICQGMPPTGGVGIGIDRMVMLFTQAHSIRDVLLFPWMKPL